MTGDHQPCGKGKFQRLNCVLRGEPVCDTARASDGLSLAVFSHDMSDEDAGLTPGSQVPDTSPAGTALPSHGCLAPGSCSSRVDTHSTAPTTAARCFPARTTVHSEQPVTVTHGRARPHTTRKAEVTLRLSSGVKVERCTARRDSLGSRDHGRHSPVSPGPAGTPTAGATTLPPRSARRTQEPHLSVGTGARACG